MACVYLAERGGFEPPIGYEPIHAFQACDLNHSSISPDGFSHVCEAAYYNKLSRLHKSILTSIASLPTLATVDVSVLAGSA